MKDNGNKNDEGKQEQNSKKLFQKGGLPGPGRGKKKPLESITIDQIEQALQQDLRNKDPKIRHPAVKLFLMLKKQQREPVKQTLDSSVQKVLTAHARYLLEDPELEQVEEEFLVKRGGEGTGLVLGFEFHKVWFTPTHMLKLIHKGE